MRTEVQYFVMRREEDQAGGLDNVRADTKRKDCGGRKCATDKHGAKVTYSRTTMRKTNIIQTRQVPVQRAVERDEIPYPYKVHDTRCIVVRSRSRSCGGGDPA